MMISIDAKTGSVIKCLYGNVFLFTKEALMQPP